MSDTYIQSILNQVQKTIDQSLTELMEVKMIRENDPTEFSYLQHELNELEEKLASLLQDQNCSSYYPSLQDAHKRICEVQDIMIKGI
ncbi:hypothetical protein [Halalkalibacter krulwichiae]|uniref:Uncharacterized protein n=1 Tax=Halalkalibacter krulwichiae TaxID=199441 RepID=A0A1X9MBA4_9BACI|nr:hypothetical protein [Halalkalibacter krulwichiae]ARK30688.1 hypothetical protein BkAM31D_13070 [Halalkalibacter krulwichiae]